MSSHFCQLDNNFKLQKEARSSDIYNLNYGLKSSKLLKKLKVSICIENSPRKIVVKISDLFEANNDYSVFY